MIPAESEVDRGDEGEHGDRDDGRQHELREVAGERGLERVDAADGERRHLRALGAVERGRPVAEPALDDVQTQVGERARRRPPPCDLEAPGGRSAARRHDDEEDERGQELPERGAGEAASRDAREQHRLGEDEQRGDDSQDGVDREHDAHGPGAANQARVERPHGGLAFGLPGDQVDRAPGGSSRPRRPRKTWYDQAW